VTGDDKINENKESKSAWVRKTPKKVHVFTIYKEKNVAMESKKSVMDSGASRSSAQMKHKSNYDIASTDIETRFDTRSGINQPRRYFKVFSTNLYEVIKR